MVSLIQNDGLRYKRKAGGSPFGNSTGQMHLATMSRFKYGTHQPRGAFKSKRLFVKSGSMPFCVEAGGFNRLWLA